MASDIQKASGGPRQTVALLTGKKAEVQEPLQKQTDFCSALSMSQNAMLWTDDMSAIMLNKAIWNVKTMFKNYIYDKSLRLKTLNRIRAPLCQPAIAQKYQ